MVYIVTRAFGSGYFFFEVSDRVHKRFQNKLPIVYHTAAKLRGGAIQWILVPTVSII